MKKILLATVLATNILINQAIAEPTKEEPKKTEQKKLKCEKELNLLNKIFEKKPTVIIRMRKTIEIAKETLEKIDAIAEKDLVDYRTKLLRPVNQFFEPLYGFKDLLQPVVTEILLNDEKVVQDIKKSEQAPILLGFFDVTKEESVTYFEKALTNKDLVKKACNEFLALCKVVTEHLTPEANKKADDLIKELIQKQSKDKK